MLETHSGCEIRTRSVRSVTDCTELCFITKESVEVLQESYPELRARIRRFVRTGQTRGKKLSKKSLNQVGLTRDEMEEYASTFEEVKEAARYVREQSEKDSMVSTDKLAPNGSNNDAAAAAAPKEVQKDWEAATSTERLEFIPWKRVVTGIRLLRKAKAAKTRIAMRRSNSATLGGAGATPPSSSPPSSSSSSSSASWRPPRTHAAGSKTLMDGGHPDEEPASPPPPTSASKTGRRKAALEVQVPDDGTAQVILRSVSI